MTALAAVRTTYIRGRLGQRFVSEPAFYDFCSGVVGGLSKAIEAKMGISGANPYWAEILMPKMLPPGPNGHQNLPPFKDLNREFNLLGDQI